MTVKQATELFEQEEEREEGVDYVSPSYIETVLSKDKRQECRDIVKAINDYRISQRQKMFLIYLLALELEDNRLMKKITGAIADENASTKDVKVLVPEGAKTQGNKGSKILLK